MRKESNVNFALVRTQVTNDILGAEAVTCSTQLLDTVFCSQLHDRRINDRVNLRRQVSALAVLALDPGEDIKALWRVQEDRVAVKEVGHCDEES